MGEFVIAIKVVVFWASVYPMTFEGASWFINDVRKFGGPALDLINDENDGVLLYGLAVEGFGGPSWFNAAGKPSANHYLESVPDVARKRIASGSGTLIFDMSNEGPAFQPHLIAAFHASLCQFGIPARRCVLLQQNRCFERHYHEWAQNQGIEPVRTTDLRSLSPPNGWVFYQCGSWI